MVKAHSKPWIVGLSYKEFPNDIECGGTLISRNIVLTAAHCPPVDMVVIGEHDLERKDGEQFIRVRKIIKHKKYTGKGTAY